MKPATDPDALVLVVHAPPELKALRRALASDYRVAAAQDLRGAIRALGMAPHVLVCARRLPDGDGAAFLVNQLQRGTVRNGLLLSSPDDEPFEAPPLEVGRRLHTQNVPVDGDALVRTIAGMLADYRHVAPPRPDLLLAQPQASWSSGVGRQLLQCWHTAGTLMVGAALGLLGALMMGIVLFAVMYVIEAAFDVAFFEYAPWRFW